MDSLAEFYHGTVANFLKTVVCFDDDAYEKEVSVTAKTASLQGDGFTDVAEDKSFQVQQETPLEVVDDSHRLEARELTDAFAKNEILCSVIKPDREAERAKAQIANLARTADVTILDWDLYKDTAIARNSVVKILKDDGERGGRLRLLVIYSAGNGPDIIDELFKLFGDYSFTKVTESEIRNEHALIVFFQKPGVLTPTAEVVAYQDLPKRIIQTFAKLTWGLFPAAALTAITELRDKTHHLLATFPPSLDGAFLAHRCLIPDPNDAEQFALDLIAGEIGTLLSHSTVNEAVNAKRCSDWVDEKSGTFDANEKKRLSKALTKYSLSKTDGFRKLFQEAKLSEEEVVDKVLDLICETHENSPSVKTELRSEYAACIKIKAAQFGKIFESESVSDRDTAEKVIGLLYKSNSGDMARAKENMSIISTIDTSIRNIAMISKSLPRLRLGSLVKNSALEYMLCIQPLCDSIRIKHNEDTLFPFLKLTIQPAGDGNKILDLCIPTKEGGAIWLKVDPSPNNLISIPFRAKSSKKPFAEAIKSGDAFIFRKSGVTDTLDWIADLKIGKAQRIVSQLAARIHTLGIDEFEWMRLHQLKD